MRDFGLLLLFEEADLDARFLARERLLRVPEVLAGCDGGTAGGEAAESDPPGWGGDAGLSRPWLASMAGWHQVSS